MASTVDPCSICTCAHANCEHTPRHNSIQEVFDPKTVREPTQQNEISDTHVRFAELFRLQENMKRAQKEVAETRKQYEEACSVLAEEARAVEQELNKLDLLNLPTEDPND
jgi:microsomal dipeptidase-like Zn-dependent dipeptidase